MVLTYYVPRDAGGYINHNRKKVRRMNALKRFWSWLLGKTTIDEQIVDAYEDAKDKAEDIADKVEERVKAIQEELKDVKEAMGKVVDQVEDVVEAAKGKKPGRK